MIRNVLIILTITLNISTFSQVSVGKYVGYNKNVPAFTKPEFERIKKMETIFFYRDNDNIKELEKAIKSVWTFNKIQFKPYSEINNVDFETTLVFKIRQNLYTNGKTRLVLQLLMNKADGSIDFMLSEINLHVSNLDELKNKGIRDNVETYYTDDAKIENWHPGIIKNYMKVINSHLIDNRPRDARDSKITDNIIKLKNNTLYIPSYAFSDDFTLGKRESVMKSYSYEYKVIGTSELNKKLLDESDDFYYLIPVQSSLWTFIMVINSRSGEVILNYGPMGCYYFNKHIIKTLVKAIDKQTIR